MAAVIVAVVAAILGTLTTLISLALLRTRLPARKNYTGRTIPTATGICFIPIILISLILGGGSLSSSMFALYLLLAAFVGFVDDVWGGSGDRGFEGHIGALLRGRISTGMLKLLGLGVGALVVGVAIFGVSFDGLVAAFLLAGFANVGNLLDVRPGRAIKFTGVPALILLPFAGAEVGFVAAGIFGGAAALFYFDLGGRIMLGDAGAAVMGSTLGCLVVAVGPGAVWWVAGATVVLLTFVAEFSSISTVIREVGVLRWLDVWGRDE